MNDWVLEERESLSAEEDLKVEPGIMGRLILPFRGSVLQHSFCLSVEMGKPCCSLSSQNRQKYATYPRGQKVAKAERAGPTGHTLEAVIQ